MVVKFLHYSGGLFSSIVHYVCTLLLILDTILAYAFDFSFPNTWKMLEIWKPLFHKISALLKKEKTPVL